MQEMKGKGKGCWAQWVQMYSSWDGIELVEEKTRESTWMKYLLEVFVQTRHWFVSLLFELVIIHTLY